MTDPYSQQPYPQDPYQQNPYQQGRYQQGQYPQNRYPGYGQQYPPAMGPQFGQPVGVKIEDPDNTIGIVGLVLAVVACGVPGLIVSWIALNKSRGRGYKNTCALIGLIIGAVYSVGVILYVVFAVILFGTLATAPHTSTSLLQLIV
ncbi:DUF4190 domain-containing protein [Tsukamurella soli]|uniref:DUF4190 domain-containing protein n=1 Tax=Tsukamurella soli TaxID=644556 RepID=A0ABP8KB82_9ACTN